MGVFSFFTTASLIVCPRNFDNDRHPEIEMPVLALIYNIDFGLLIVVVSLAETLASLTVYKICDLSLEFRRYLSQFPVSAAIRLFPVVSRYCNHWPTLCSNSPWLLTPADFPLEFNSVCNSFSDMISSCFVSEMDWEHFRRSRCVI